MVDESAPRFLRAAAWLKPIKFWAGFRFHGLLWERPSQVEIRGGELPGDPDAHQDEQGLLSCGVGGSPDELYVNQVGMFGISSTHAAGVGSSFVQLESLSHIRFFTNLSMWPM